MVAETLWEYLTQTNGFRQKQFKGGIVPLRSNSSCVPLLHSPLPQLPLSFEAKNLVTVHVEVGFTVMQTLLGEVLSDIFQE